MYHDTLIKRIFWHHACLLYAFANEKCKQLATIVCCLVLQVWVLSLSELTLLSGFSLLVLVFSINDLVKIMQISSTWAKEKKNKEKHFMIYDNLCKIYHSHASLTLVVARIANMFRFMLSIRLVLAKGHAKPNVRMYIMLPITFFRFIT